MPSARSSHNVERPSYCHLNINIRVLSSWKKRLGSCWCWWARGCACRWSWWWWWWRWWPTCCKVLSWCGGAPAWHDVEGSMHLKSCVVNLSVLSPTRHIISYHHIKAIIPKRVRCTSGKLCCQHSCCHRQRASQLTSKCCLPLQR